MELSESNLTLILVSTVDLLRNNLLLQVQILYFSHLEIREKKKEEKTEKENKKERIISLDVT